MLKKGTKPAKRPPGEPKTYEEFVKAMMRALLDGLITGGTKEVYSVVWQWLGYYTEWHDYYSITKRTGAKKK